RRVGAVPGMALADTQAEREPSPAHPAPQAHLLASSLPILAVPRGRTRRDPPVDRAARLLIGPLERERRRLLREPGGRDGIDRQGGAGESPKHAVEMGRTEGIAALPPSVIMERGACEAGLEQGEPPTCLQTCPHLLEGLR